MPGIELKPGIILLNYVNYENIFMFNSIIIKLFFNFALSFSWY